MRILLLSAYDAASHRSWRKQLVAGLPQYDWQQLVLPARYFNWRIRGNSLSWAFEQRELLEQDYDLLLATDMVDLNGLRGFVPKLGSVPAIVYFHENQFAYPVSGQMQQEKYLEAKVVNLYAALSANKVVFNSGYNRDSFIADSEEFLKQMPDHVPSGLTEKISAKSDIIPVPIRDEYFAPCLPGNKPPLLVWNHRWEYDKAPERLYAFLSALVKKQVDFKINIIGAHFRRQPEVFAHIERDFADKLLHFGYLQSHEEYRKVLQQSDFVLSTAIHDFQGLALIEAIASGCVPLVPDRLNYPDYIPDTYRYASYLDDVEKEANAMAELLIDLIQQPQLEPVDVDQFKMQNLAQRYDNLFRDTGAMENPDASLA